MTYQILVDDKSKYDPFDANYIYSDKTLKQAHQKLVETEFNIKIEYVEYEKYDSDIDLVNQIKLGFLDLRYKKNNLFAAVVPNKVATNLGINNYAVELYDASADYGIFKDLEVNQNEYNNILTSINSKVYGYSNSYVYGEQYIYYNKTKVTELGLEDPLVMWMKGTWTQQNFELWVESAQEKLTTGEYVIDINYDDYMMGISAASGTPLTFPPQTTVNFTSKEVINVYKNMRTYYKNGWWANKETEQNVSDKFKNSETILHSGYLYYLNNDKYFSSDIEFEIGIIPYPVQSSDNIIMTEPFEINLINNSKVIYDTPIQVNEETLKTDDGKPIYGVNVANSSYKNRSLEGSIYNNNSSVVIFNFEYKDYSAKEIFHVIKRLSEIENNEVENEEFINYLKENKLSDLNIDVILSTQNKECVEIEILRNLDFNLNLKSSNSSMTSLYNVSYSLVTTDETIAVILRNLQNGYKNLI